MSKMLVNMAPSSPTFQRLIQRLSQWNFSTLFKIRNIGRPTGRLEVLPEPYQRYFISSICIFNPIVSSTPIRVPFFVSSYLLRRDALGSICNGFSHPMQRYGLLDTCFNFDF